MDMKVPDGSAVCGTSHADTVDANAAINTGEMFYDAPELPRVQLRASARAHTMGEVG